MRNKGLKALFEINKPIILAILIKLKYDLPHRVIEMLFDHDKGCFENWFHKHGFWGGQHNHSNR